MNAVVKEWSPYQTSVFAFVTEGTGNCIIEAVAGSGKTTTIVEAMRRTFGTSIFLAFNKAIQVELSSRGVNAKTFHGLTFKPVMTFKKQKQITQDKLRQIVDANLGDDDVRTYGSFICKLVSLARNNGVGCLVADVESEWYDLIDKHDMELPTEEASLEKAVMYARKLLSTSNESPLVDFDDLLYLAVKEGLTLDKYDHIFGDEMQDTNAIQRAILRKIMKPTSRFYGVGDPSQAIYGFRGADSNSMGLLATEFQCVKLPLTVSYRCPTSVVEYARRWVSHIEAAPNAIAGEVESLGTDWITGDFEANDLVVCRTTKPLISLAFKLLKARVPVRIMGKEIGDSLITLIERMKAKGIDALAVKLEVWASREAEKAIAKKQETKAEAIRDRVDAILCLIEGLDETERTIPALCEIIRGMFDSGPNQVILATIHKAKGLESPHVFWLNSSKCPSPYARQEWQMQQEANLCYVAVTRAQRTLTLIEEKDQRKVA